jgi:general secretion pathway protein D
MNKYYNVLLILALFFYTGCTLVNVNKKPNTKKYLLKGIEDKLTPIEINNDVSSLSENQIIEDMQMDNSNDYSNIEEVTNLKPPVHRKGTTYRNDSLNNKNYFDKKKVKLSIEAMPLNKFINLMFSKVLNVNFVLDKSIEKNTQPVSLNIKEQMSKNKLFDMVLNILDEFNVAINVEKDIFYIKASTKQFVSAQGMYVGSSLPINVNDNSIVYILKPYYYNMHLLRYSDLVRKYFLSQKATLKIDASERFIKIRDKAKNIRKAIKFYNFLDKPSMHNKNLKLIKMKYMDTEDFIKQIRPVLEGYGIIISESLRQPGVKFIPIKQINAFLLISDKESWVNTILLWKNKLDVPSKKKITERGFFVYKPSNRKADELVSIIGNFISTKSETVSLDDNRSTNQNRLNKTLFSDNLQVVLDEERNNIIIHSTQREYIEISKMLKQLDTLPKQILIEVTIAEVTLRDSMQFGLEWFLKTRGSNYGLTLNALGSGSAGIAGILTSTSGDFGLNFNALQTNKYVNVLSNPKLLVLNNHTGTINVGNQVPIVSSQSTASDLGTTGGQPSVLQNIQYRNTGIQLSVKPTINSKGYLTLNINQNVSNAQTNDTSDISSPLIFDRSLTTDVLLKSGEMVVLGGLITENKSSDTTKLPFLGSIPILGKLFSTSGDSIDKTELVIMVKPTILRSSQDTQVITDILLNLIGFE